MTTEHVHVYDNFTRWPEARCACGDIGMYPPVEVVELGNGKTGVRPLTTLGPVYWCQVCGACFMTEKWARDHYERVQLPSTLADGTVMPGEVHVMIQLRAA